MNDPEPAAAAPGWTAWAASKNAKAKAKHRWRVLRPLDARATRADEIAPAHQPTRAMVSFAGNDYLGLSAHPGVATAAKEAIDHWGTGSGASRLVSGTRPVHAELESLLAQWKSCPAALVYPTGYTTNLGVLGALAGPGVLVCSDAYNHASIVDGCRLATAAGADVRTYPHLDLAALGKLLACHTGRALVVTDSVFSMDGDSAPVDELGQLCARHEALLVLDEAHAVLGPHFEALPCEVLRTGTLSKTLGSLGGFVAGRDELIDLLVNRSRPFIYTTALSPADAAAAAAALRVLRSAEGEILLARLEGHVQRFKPGRMGQAPIVPIVVGTEEAALAASSALAEQGLLVPAVRPPTVPPGTSRLRVTLSAAHSDAEVSALLEALGTLGLWRA